MIIGGGRTLGGVERMAHQSRTRTMVHWDRDQTRHIDIGADAVLIGAVVGERTKTASWIALSSSCLCRQLAMSLITPSIAAQEKQKKKYL